MVTNIIYIGSNKTTFIFDFFTKKTGNIVENKNVAKLNNVELTQEQYDMISKSDEAILTGDVECYFDLSGITTNLYDGNIANLKNALNSINTNNGLIWNGTSYENYTEANKANYIDNNSIIRIKYTNPDYICIECNLKRSLDQYKVDTLPQINVGGYNCILQRNISPAWDSNSAEKLRVMWLLKKNANNYYELNFDNVTKKFNYVKCVNGKITTLSSKPQSFLKWQCINIFCEQTGIGMTMRILKNNGTIERSYNLDNTMWTGNAILYSLTRDVIGNEADVFQEFIHFRNLNISDEINNSRAKNILEENTELLDKTLSDSQTINVLPNNVYELKTNINITITITEMYNNIVLNTRTVSNDIFIQTSSRTNKIKFDITGSFESLSFTIFNKYIPETWAEMKSIFTWNDIKTIPRNKLEISHGGAK